MPNERNYRVTVHPMPQYLADQSDPAHGRYLYAYTISISNESDTTVQLLTRHWIITDGNNEVQEVRGEGVVGQQPRIKPGETFRYTSGSSMTTPIGTMKGTYQFIAEDGTQFAAEIPEFALVAPHALH